MSGNPFRKQNPPSQPSVATPRRDFEDSIPRTEDVLPIDTERRTSTVKRVRIATPPPLSPDSPYEENPIIRRVSNESHEGSPPPSPQYLEESSSDSEADNDDESYGPIDEPSASAELINNTRRNSETSEYTRNATGGIVNPFQRTLATMEPKDDSTLEADSADAAADPLNTAPIAAKPNRDQMDVDAFKRMLLTGNPKSTEQGKPSLTTDFGYVAGTPNQEKKIKPPPPKHRHGKSVEQQRTPQTVSFDDFTPTEVPQVTPKPYAKALPPTPASQRNTSEELSPSSLPAVPSIPPNESAQRQETEQILEHTEPPLQSQSSQRNPPPPPLARRSSQAQAKRQSLIRENSASSYSSPRPPLSASLPPGPATPTGPKPVKAPPPPPARRPGSKQVSTYDSAFQEGVQPVIVDEPANMESSRSSSLASRNRISMPPPPPPRRRGSSKSSSEHPAPAALASSSPSGSRRTSQETDSKTSELHLARGAENQNNRTAVEGGDMHIDVLADMERLQAEVDALRAKYGKNS